MFTKKLSPLLLQAGVIASVAVSDAMAFGSSCGPLYKKAVLNLDFNPTQIAIEKLDGKDALYIPSFFNAYKNPVTRSWEGGYLDRDKIGVVRDIRKAYKNFNALMDIEIITDIALGRESVEFGNTQWPNGIEKAPDGMFPFQAIILPQGFHSAQKGVGRLSMINMDDPEKTEYIIHQSTVAGPFATGPRDPANSPRYYHEAKFFDMDGDGDLDVISVRSGFKVGGGPPRPPYGELVWFENPGEDLDPNVQWNETVLWGGEPGVDNYGPDIHLDMADLDGDGYPEIVTTNFWVGENIRVMGAPIGGTWADVDWDAGLLPQQAIIGEGQGRVLDVEIGDINNDRRPDILASNHQSDNCHDQTADPIPGRVWALEKPRDGNIYQLWTTHILKDNIRPQPSTIPISGFGRLAPGPAHAFSVIRFLDGLIKPNILVGGDEAGKAWVLRPKHPFNPRSWEYHSDVIFDINDYYGEYTTQTFIEAPDERTAITVSTQGSPAIGYDRDGPFGVAELYIPVFEGRDIHIFSYNSKRGRRDRVQCGTEDLYACPVLPE